MANLSCLLATTFSIYYTQGCGTQIQGCGTQIQGHFSSKRPFLLPLVLFFVLFTLSFLRLIVSLSLLCSSVTEALFALSFSFLNERCLYFFGFSFDHAKATLPYSINEGQF